MNLTEMQKDKINASILKVETLQKEYEVTLTRYQEAIQNYISSLENDETNKINLETVFVSLKGRTWWGISGLKEMPVNSITECENMCISDSKCSGATFNPVKKYCWMRTGEGQLSSGQPDDYAIIRKQSENLSIIIGLNDKLLKINDEISLELTNVNNDMNELNDAKTQKQIELKKSYQILLEQKYEMEKQLFEYASIKEEEHNNSLFVNQQNVSLRFWVLITCLVLLVCIKTLIGSQSTSFSLTLWMSIIIVLTILSYSLNAPTGFAMWFILFVAIILTNIN